MLHIQNWSRQPGNIRHRPLGACSMQYAPPSAHSLSSDFNTLRDAPSVRGYTSEPYLINWFIAQRAAIMAAMAALATAGRLQTLREPADASKHTVEWVTFLARHDQCNGLLWPPAFSSFQALELPPQTLGHSQVGNGFRHFPRPVQAHVSLHMNMRPHLLVPSLHGNRS